MRLVHRTQGATLIVSLLFVMLLLAIIMAVTAQITLSTRRSSADQEQILRARYSAESGLSVVQARLRTMSALIGQASVPANTTDTQMANLILNLCPAGASMPAPGSLETEVCALGGNLNSADASANPRVNLFRTAVSGTTFHDAGFPASDAGSQSRFWSELFSGQGGATYSGSAENPYQVQFGLNAQRVTREGSRYRLYFTVPPLTATGEAGGATQRLGARPTGDQYHLLVSRGSFARYALFTNHHYMSAADEASTRNISFTSRTLLSGPVHTNQTFTFTGTPYFGGQVTSAGCPAGYIAQGATSCGAAAKPGATFGSTFRTLTDEAAPSFDGVTPHFAAGTPPVWNADFIPMPANSNDQQGAAQSGGLALTGTVDALSLSRIQVDGAERQQIEWTQGAVTTRLSYGEDRRLYLWNGSDWTPAVKDPATGAYVAGGMPAEFNGVIHVEGQIANLNGGPNAEQPAPTGASVASFAGITVAASGDIAITSNLTYTDPPCTGDNAPGTPAPCDNLNAKNILGVYSSAGNVELVSPRSCPTSTCTSLGNDPRIHAVLMASEGSVRVRGYDQGAPLGSVHLLGGIIENYYGGFGTFGGDRAVSGYDRNFVYDQRTYDGYAPPSFPTAVGWNVSLAAQGGVNLTGGIRWQGESVSVRQ